MRALTVLCIIAALGLGMAMSCGNSNKGREREAAAEPQAPAEPTSSRSGEAQTAPGGVVRSAPRLAESPAMSLVDNRFLWHLSTPGSPDGFMMPLGSEGLRKYTQEYSQPWGEAIAVGERSGRTLTARSALLRFPWHESGAATLRLRAHGSVNGQRITVAVNGKRLANADLGADWQILDLSIEKGILKAGENELQLFVGKRGGPGNSYGIFHSIDIIPGTAGADTTWPPLSPASRVTIAGEAKGALTGFARMTMYLEIPESGWLTFHAGAPGGAAELAVKVRAAEAQEARELWRGKVEQGRWQRQDISLADLAGQLVALELSASSPSAAWGAPRIALEEAGTRPARARYDNAIMLVIDAMRADRIALYGETRVNTEHMTGDGRARGVTFLYNQAASPSSPPSHGSIQTGMIPRVHGVTGDKGQLKPGTPMLSTQLEDAGIAAAYFGNNPFGMERLQKPGRWTAFHQPSKEGGGIDCVPLMDKMLGFAEQQARAGKRFFISSLPYETHTPYRYHEGITDKYHPGPWGPPVGKNVDGDLLGALSAGKVILNESQWAQLKALYDGEAEYMDRCYKQLMDGLRERNLLTNTLIIITSDHGEGMFEHGRMGHAFGHYAELANIPLVLIGDGLVEKGITIKTVTSHLDIVPTILELMGVSPSDRIQGMSLVPLIKRSGPWTPRVMPLEYGRSYALRAAQWKYIADYQQVESVFDLKNDPTEQQNLRDKHPMALRYLRDIAGFFLAHRQDWKMATFGSFNNHASGFLSHVGAEPM